MPKEVHVKLTKESGTYSAAGVSGAQDEPDESPSKGEGNRRQLKLGDDQYIGFDEDGEEDKLNNWRTSQNRHEF